jgi:hypothetical protein
MSSVNAKIIELPFDGLFNIWRKCFGFASEKERSKLNLLDDNITKRKALFKNNHLMIRLTISELNWIKNLYENPM